MVMIHLAISFESFDDHKLLGLVGRENCTIGGINQQHIGKKHGV